MSIVIKGDVLNEASKIATRISKEYNLTTKQMGILVQFEYGQYLEIDKLITENAAKVHALENVAEELLGYSLIRGPGKCSSKNLPADPRDRPAYKFKCEYVIFSKDPIRIGKETLLEKILNKKQKIADDSLMICTEKEDLRYFYIGRQTDGIGNEESGISDMSDLNSLCGCKDVGCSLANYFSIKDLCEIDEDSFYRQIEGALLERLPQYSEI